jgi:SAM-dependent methyltransferase
VGGPVEIIEVAKPRPLAGDEVLIVVRAAGVGNWDEFVRLRVRWMELTAGGPMLDGDEIRDAQRATWAGLSAGWEKWDRVIMDQLGPVGTAIIERLDIAADQQHLDIAAGTGEPGLTVARLAPEGHVVLTDLAAEMLDIATRRADAQGITNFATTMCSADDLPFGDAAFDSISVRFGYMFFPDVAKATAEFARVLRPGCARLPSGTSTSSS